MQPTQLPRASAAGSVDSEVVCPEALPMQPRSPSPRVVDSDFQVTILPHHVVECPALISFLYQESVAVLPTLALRASPVVLVDSQDSVDSAARLPMPVLSRSAVKQP